MSLNTAELRTNQHEIRSRSPKSSTQSSSPSPDRSSSPIVKTHPLHPHDVPFTEALLETAELLQTDVADANATAYAVVSIWRRIALKLLELDHAASARLHAASFYPFDLLLVPFALMCGIYGMPMWIPVLAFVENHRLALLLLLSTLLTAILTTIGKRTTKRIRPMPSSLARKILNLRKLENNFSFPSGDSAQGAVLACNLYFYVHAGQIIYQQQNVVLDLIPAYFLLLLIPFVMSARVYFGAHWWSDTVMGAIIGFAASYTVWYSHSAFGGLIGGDTAGSGAHATLLSTLGFLPPHL